MKICFFHPVRLPPKNYGGSERVLLWLAKGLLERGHEVSIVAKNGSQLHSGIKLIEVPENASAEILLDLLPSSTELVHFMAPPEEYVSAKLPCPSILTVHGNGKLGEIFPKNSVFLSKNHAERHQAETFVYNGIDPAEYLFEPGKKENWFLFLSKTNWRVKNLSGALLACKKAKAKLRVAGGPRPYSTRLRIWLNPEMKWEGPVSGNKKAKLLASAAALLFPVLWPEPFGLVVVEALMSGTPVFASRRGSLSELITPEVGALVDPDQLDHFEDVLTQRSKRWDPIVCREWAMKNFHYQCMAESYETVYKRVCRGEVLNEREPVAGDWRNEV